MRAQRSADVGAVGGGRGKRVSGAPRVRAIVAQFRLRAVYFIVQRPAQVVLRIDVVERKRTATAQDELRRQGRSPEARYGGLSLGALHKIDIVQDSHNTRAGAARENRE